MRFRPLGARGQIVSAVSLILEPDSTRRRPSDWTSLIYAALECGVSGFEIRALDPVLGQGLGEALAAVERRMAFVVLRLAVHPGRVASLEAVAGQIRAAVATTGLDYLDAALFDPPALNSPQGLKELGALKSAGLVRALGVCGSTEAVDPLVGSGQLDLLATEFSLLSGWTERRRVRSAVATDMAVLGYGCYPKEQLEALIKPRPKERANPLAGAGGYCFLNETKDWTCEEICLAYALTEPSLASVQVKVRSVEHLEQLAAVPEREFPPAVAAQIEMARFSALAESEARACRANL